MLSRISRGFASNVDKIAAASMFGRKPLPGVGRVILAASCKGGVGKSTVALNTAVALSKNGAKVGLFDADIYGPSVPTMTKTVSEGLLSDKDSNFIPNEAFGIETVSVGYALDPKDALLWKGPLAGKIIT